MAFGFIQSKTGGTYNAASSTSIAAVFGSAVVSGDFVHGAVTWGDLVITLSSVNDDKGNTYTKGQLVKDTPNTQSFQTFHLWDITNAPATITCHFSSAVNFSGVQIAEYSGVLQSGDPLDVEEGRTVTNPGTTTNALASSASGTLTNAADLIIGSVTEDGAGVETTLSAGTSPQTATVRETFTVSTFVVAELEDYFQGAAANMRATFTPAIDGATSSYIVIASAYKPIPAAAGIVERRTSNHLGIRVGSRQTQAH